MSKDLFTDWESVQTTFRPGPPAQTMPHDDELGDWPFNDDDEGEGPEFCFERRFIGARCTLDGKPAKIMRDMSVHMARIDPVDLGGSKSMYCFCDTVAHVLDHLGGRFLTETHDTDTGFE
jgi:hypothetical protein